MISNNYNDIKNLFDNLNKDKSHFINSNDVCTPIECVKEIVDTIPNSFWGDNTVKILDPCCGNGNFFGYILTKFNDKSYALKNNLFFNDLNEIRLNNVKSIFGDNVNITKKDFLLFEENEKYDLIIANPPYALFTNGVRAAKNHNLSRLFIKKSLSLVKENGFIAFIVPDNWMSLSDRNDTVELLSQYQFLKISIHNSKKYFPGIGSSFTWFVLQKKENNEKFIIQNNYRIKTEDFCFLNKKSMFIPLYYNGIVKSIIEKTLLKDNEKFKIITSSDLHKYTKKDFLSTTKNDTFKYEIIHTPKQIIWSNRPHKFQNGWKVFISLTDKYSTFVKENCGATQSIAFIMENSKEEADITSNSLAHPLYVFLNNICRYGNFNNIRVLQKFPKNKTNDIFNEFKLNIEEINLIKKFNESF